MLNMKKNRKRRQSLDDILSHLTTRGGQTPWIPWAQNKNQNSSIICTRELARLALSQALALLLAWLNQNFPSNKILWRFVHELEFKKRPLKV